MSRSTEILVVVGTRPEIIKMAPVVREIRSDPDLQIHLVHTNQHYDRGMSEVFFQNLELSPPDENLDIGSASHGEQTAKAIVGVEELLAERTPGAALAEGDTNAVLSTAIAASKLPTIFGHVEAGIRSFDRTMPEEVNRVLADHAADLLFAPTETAAGNLEAEGIVDDVHVTGNTVVDACREHAEFAEGRSTVIDRLDLDRNGYVLVTIHRPRNTDDPDRLHEIVATLDGSGVPVVFPAHPRTRSVLDAMDYESSGDLRILEPLDYLDFLKLERHARVIVTDSGGVQEEASILEVPCLTVRPNTERPETIESGVNVLLEPEELAAELHSVYNDRDRRASMTGHPDLYGDGNASTRIVDVLRERILFREA